jgi:hypothetical protein
VIGYKDMTLGTFMNFWFDKLGTVHGQQLTGYVYLKGDSFEYQQELPFFAGSVYKVGFEANDKKQCVWLVEYIQDARMRFVMICPMSFVLGDSSRQRVSVRSTPATGEGRKVTNS